MKSNSGGFLSNAALERRDNHKGRELLVILQMENKEWKIL